MGCELITKVRFTLFIHKCILQYSFTDVDIDEVNTSIRITVIVATCRGPTYLECGE